MKLSSRRHVSFAVVIVTLGLSASTVSANEREAWPKPNSACADADPAAPVDKKKEADAKESLSVAVLDFAVETPRRCAAW